MEEKLAIDLTVSANAMLSPFNTKHGRLNIGQPGIDFLADNLKDYLQFPWQQISYISADIFLGFYYRGIYIVLKDGMQFQLITSKTKKILQVAAKYLDANQIRYRKSVLDRKAKKDDSK